jgi:putative molybdopterin biosynthesis protein
MKPIFHRIKEADEAFSCLLAEAQRCLYPLNNEVIDVRQSLGRITARAVFAKYSSPAYHSSAMDGYAVRYRDTLLASEREPIHLRLGQEAIYVDTGDPLPEGFDAVIMIEEVNIIGDKIEIYQPVSPYQHVRVIGEDIVATEMIVPENHKIRAIDMAAIIASGILEIEVRKRPLVSIIPTGSEIIPPDNIRTRPPQPPEIIEYNSVFIKGILEECGAVVNVCDILKDNLEDIKGVVSRETIRNDLVIIIAGSGKGSEDYTARVIEDLGRLIIHGVAIKPGKPFIFGIINDKPVVGIPGYPVSAYICLNLFVLPIIQMMTGDASIPKETIKAILSRQFSSSVGVDEFVRVKVGSIGDKLIATPIGRGAGLMMSVVRADGILKIPASSEGYNAGTQVEIQLLRPLDSVKDTIVCIGSHDNTLDVLANFIRRSFPRLSLSSAHVGSLGGIMAIKRGEAHIAGSHLLDEVTGQYNIPFINRLLADRKVTLVNLVYREQGLLVPKGNPKGIKGFEDLVRADVIYINRQAGSGTRLLLDKHLKELGINPKDIRGYGREEYTHMSVASAVLTGLADTGLAVYSSAQALGLDFIPVAKERYDLIIPTDFLELEGIKALLWVIRQDNQFRDAVRSLGGYDTTDMGKVLYP